MSIMNQFISINRKKSLSIIVFLITFLTMFSCKDQDIMFKEYVVEGGIPYLGTVSGLKARVGYNRLELNFSVVDATTSRVGIYWNDYRDSIMIDVESATQVKQIINLPEGQYSLFVVSFDKNGNKSNPAELITRTVGENYLASIIHRGFKSKKTSYNNDLIIEWQNADTWNGARFTELIYTSIDGTEKHVTVENEETVTIIDDYQNGTSFNRITYYSPDGMWLDTIVPAAAPVKTLMIDKKLGGVIAFSSESGGNVAKNFYNGNQADMWLTSSNYPEYATIDIGRELLVSGFGVWPSYQQTNGRADPRAPTLIRFECSINNIDWTTVGEFNYDNSMYYFRREFEIPITRARYVRFVGVECAYSPVFGSGIGGPGNKLMNLAELDIFFHLDNK